MVYYGNATYYNSDFFHYGVKGMKWGVRRYQNKDGTPTNRGKQRISANLKSAPKTNHESNANNDQSDKEWSTTKKVLVGAAAVTAILAVVGTERYMHNKIDAPIQMTSFRFGEKIDLKSLPDKDYYVTKPKIFRMSSKQKEEITDKGRMYISYHLKDRFRYKEDMPEYFKDWQRKGIISDGSKAYEHAIRLKKPIKVASERAIAEAYMKANKVSDIDQGYYQRFMGDLVSKDNPIVDKFFDILKSKGYDALPDLNDRGYTKNPLILLNPKDVILSDKSHQVKTIESIINTILL